MNIFAHRGYSAVYPENTLRAFQEAAKLPIYGVEFDVHLTKDGEVVVIHDELIDRTSNGTGFVKDYTLAQLRELDFGSWKDAQFAGEKIPTLAEVFNIYKLNNHMLNIELKTDVFEYEGIEKIVLNIIKSFNFEDRVIISSFNHASLLRIRELHPTIPTGALFGSLILNLQSYIESLQCQALHIPYFYAARDIIQEIRIAGMPVRTYTVNKTDVAHLVKAAHVQAIFTDEPEKMLANLK